MNFDDDVAKELSADTSKEGYVSEETDSRFQLLTKLISTPETLSEDEESFRKLEKLIRSDFLKLCSGIGIPGESALYNELLLMLSDLRKLIEFPYLANKNLLAVGGGFSAGKSRFLNSIVGEELLLPEGIQPTTAIPTWRLEKFSNRDFLRWEKVAELFYASERKNCKQDSSLIRIFLLNSNAQDFWFCETQFCSEKDLNRNLVTQEGAKILFTSKSTCKYPSPI